ncbi:MAG: histidine phosphatase family protein [Chloroflexi bacterium]|nr:histidine phosphatase family protein [Chloroflexota bacterium]
MMRVTRHTDVWLVRHPQTDWNKERRYQSRSDRPLTDFGRLRLDAIAQRLRRIRFSAIITSELNCTDEVAQAVAAQQIQAPQIVRDARWREADHGDWEGLTYSEVQARYPAQVRQRFGSMWNNRAHGGESVADLWQRVQAAWNDALRQHNGEHLLIVTHATPIQLLLCAMLNLPFEQYWQWRIDLGGITNLDLYPSGAITRVINEVPPLISRA